MTSSTRRGGPRLGRAFAGLGLVAMSVALSACNPVHQPATAAFHHFVYTGPSAAWIEVRVDAPASGPDTVGYLTVAPSTGTYACVGDDAEQNDVPATCTATDPGAPPSDPRSWAYSPTRLTTAAGTSLGFRRFVKIPSGAGVYVWPVAGSFDVRAVDDGGALIGNVAPDTGPVIG